MSMRFRAEVSAVAAGPQADTTACSATTTSDHDQPVIVLRPQLVDLRSPVSCCLTT